MYTFAIYVFAH